MQPVLPHLFHSQPFKNYVRSDRLWMHAAQRKLSSEKSNMMNKLTDNRGLLTQKTLNKNGKETSSQRCGINVLQHNLIQNVESVRRSNAKKHQIPKILDQNMFGGGNVGILILPYII